jgi:hypothetical protein
LSLDCTAIGIKDRLFLGKPVDLSLCRYGAIKIVSNPAADSSLGVVEQEEIRLNKRQRCCLNADFYFVFLALRNGNRSKRHDGEKEGGTDFHGGFLIDQGHAGRRVDQPQYVRPLGSSPED